MKPLNKIALILVFSILIIGAKSSIDTTNKQLPPKIEILGKNNTSDKINDLQNQLKLVLEKNDDLQKRIDLSTTIIQGQDSFINRTLMTYSILMTLIAIILGFVSYFFLIKPSSDLVKDAKEQEKKLDNKFNNKIEQLESQYTAKISEFNINYEKYKNYVEILSKDINDNLDKKFLEFIENQKKKQLENFLFDLLSDDLEARNNASNFISTLQDIKLTEEQSGKIYKKLSLGKQDYTEYQFSILQSFLSKQNCTYAEIYFENASKKDAVDDEGTFYRVMDYFKNSGINNHWETIVNSILNSKNPFKTYQMVLGCFYDNKQGVLFLLNHKELNSKMRNEDINLIFYQYVKEIKEITKTYLYSLLKMSTCTCCGYKTITLPAKSMEFCQACFWCTLEKNNKVSLKEAQRNFITIGVYHSDAFHSSTLLAPKEHFEKDSEWKPIE